MTIVHGTSIRAESTSRTAFTPPNPQPALSQASWSQIARASDYARVRKELAVLKRQQRDQAETMLMLVHELRSPVTASKSLVAALRYVGQERDSQVDDALIRIENRMEQLLNLVDDILRLSQVKAGHTMGAVTVVDLVPETVAVCQPYLEEAAAKGLSMTLDLPEAPVPVRIAPQAYHLILSNLVSNAVKYTSAGSVRLSLRQEGSRVTLRVTDTGMGIPAGDIPKLFNEFFRASNARRSRIAGTGLGLAGVKALVERSAGGLQVDSRENEGSSFVVRLPLHEDHPPARHESQERQHSVDNLIPSWRLGESVI